MYLKNAISQLLECKEFSKPFAPLLPETSSFSLFQPKNPEILKDFIEITEDAKPAAAVPEFNFTNRKLTHPKPKRVQNHNKKYKIYETELTLNPRVDNSLQAQL